MSKYKIELVLDEQDEENLRNFIKHLNEETMSEEEIESLSTEDLIKELFWAECSNLHGDYNDIDLQHKVTIEKIE